MTHRPVLANATAAASTHATLRTRLRPTALAVRALCMALLGGTALAPVWAQTAPAITRNLPNPCSVSNVCAGFTGPAGSAGRNPITGLGSSATLNSSVANQLTVTQSTGTALNNWRSFDIANGNTVLFNHAANQSFVSINRIHDTQASSIAGRLSAPLGQIYLINPNGLLFNGTASVDVAGLIASTLDIDPSRAVRGLLGASSQIAAFSLVADNPLAATAGVQIDAGAVIKAGNVYVFAPTISNAGQLTVNSGGQVVLAAGQRAFLAGSDSATLRGLLVEVGQGGTVTNSGEILTPRGNTTMVGMAVNQNGRVTATSAINENGSVWLRAVQAADASLVPVPSISSGTFTASFLNPQASGSVSLGSGSTTQVVLDAADRGTAALTDANAAAARSVIVAEGAQISVGGNATGARTLVQARGGDIRLNARTDPSAILGTEGRVLGDEDATATLAIGADARLDASGERNVAIDGTRNFIYIDRLTSNDLRDAPTQRDGFLRGQGVYVNVAQDHAFIDLAARRDAVEGTQAERNASAGTIALRAEGRVDVAAGAQLDVSGGSTVTSTATGRTSQLLTADGRVVDVMRAATTDRYVGFADRVTRTVESVREGISSTTVYDAPRLTTVVGSTEGRNAGTVELIAPRGSFAGSVSGATTPSISQRGSTAPLAGQLRIGSTAAEIAALDSQVSLSRANVLLTGSLANAAAAVAADPQDRTIAIDTTMLRRGGVGRLSVISDGTVTVTADAPIDAGARGQISLQGNAVQVDASLTAAGGSITVGERPAIASAIGNREALSLVALEVRRIGFGTGVALDASGRVNNDSTGSSGVALTTPVLRDGGSIGISGRQADVSRVARFDVDAGASVSTTGALTGGRAGTLSIVATDTSASTVDQADAGALNLGNNFAARVSGHGFTQGGRLTLGAPRLTIGPAERGSDLRIDAALLDRGFESLTFNATDALTVQAGTALVPSVDVFVATPSLRNAADGSSVRDVLTPQAAIPAQQRPAQLAFNASRPLGTVAFESGSRVDACTQGSISAMAGQSVLLDGALRARSGSVALQLRELSEANYQAFTLEQQERRAIQLGDEAVIDVSAASRVLADANGRRTGSVLDGGSISLDAVQGSLAMDRRALIVADGIRDQVDIGSGGNAQRTEVGSRGGAVSLAGLQSLLIDGSVSARAGSADVEGGRLSVRFDGVAAQLRDPLRRPADEVYDALFRADRVLSIGSPTTELPALGDRFTAADYAGQGRMATALVNDSGFDTVWLASTNTLASTGNLDVRVRGSLTLDAQAVRLAPDSTLTLRANSVALGNRQDATTFAANEDAAASGGTGRLSITARSVDLVGRTAIQGASTTNIAASGDVSLRSNAVVTGTPGRVAGVLSTVGNLQITAAQVTPATQTDFTLRALDGAVGAGGVAEPGRIVVAPSGQAALEPLSAAGTVTLNASQIQIDGRLSAPHGSIAVEATDSVRLGAQAVLSVAGSQNVPYGSVFNSSQWQYGDNPALGGFDIATPAGVTLPEKRLRIAGRLVDVDPQARIDVSGGGELVAQEFVAGPGGSIDVRQNFVPTSPTNATLVRNGFFALIPARGNAAAPFDPQLYSGLTQDAARGGAGLLRAGQMITIGAGSEIPPGTYTVMPARYALLPGAYALQPASGYADLSPARGIAEGSGTAIVAGRLGAEGAGASTARWSGYRVYNGTQFRRLAEFRESTGSSFFTAAAQAAGEVAPRTAVDAGALSIAAEELRVATGSLRTAAASSTANGVTTMGRGAEVALSAPQIVVTEQTVSASATPGDTLTLNAQALSGLKAETLVLGAAVTHGDGTEAQRDRLTLERVARNVSVSGAQPLAAGEVLLAASERVDVAAASTISADTAQAPVTGRIDVAGDGAALLVSDGAALPVFARSGATGAGGDLAVADAARLAGRSLLFDASRDQRYAASVALAADNLGLSASSINLGEVPADAVGLNLSNALLAQLAAVDNLSLTSGSAFNVYGTAQVGSAGLRSLALDGAGFLARSADPAVAPSASATVVAGDVTLRNSTATLPADLPGAGTGSLAINAVGGGTGNAAARGNVKLAGGDLAGEARTLVTQGFATTTLTATGQPAAGAAASRAGTGQILLTGRGGLSTEGALTLDAARIAAGSGANHDLRAAGALSTLASSAASPETSQVLGATLALSGERIDHAGRIELPSGNVSLNATGPLADVTLASGSTVDVAGSTQRFATQTADAAAGRVTLSAADGSVRALAGSRIDVAGADGRVFLADGSLDTTPHPEAGRNSDAGTLRISAVAGTVQLDGTLDARASPAAGSTARGAEIALDVGTLPDLGTLARPLQTASGGVPVQSLDVRVRNGDTTLAAADTLAASTLRVAADGGARADRPEDGQVRIDGRLNASGVRGGRVELYGRDSATLGATGSIDAHATGAGEEGGTVLLSGRITETPQTAGAPLDAVRIEQGARIDVRALDGGSANNARLAGTVTLRAPRVGSNEVAIQGVGAPAGGDALPTDYLVGARQEGVEGTVVQNSTGNLALNTIGVANASNPLPTLRTTLRNYMSDANRAAMTDRLGRAGDPIFHLRPGLEIRTSGNIAIANAIDFTAGLTAGSTTDGNFQWRYGGTTIAGSEPGALTLRAGGNITLTNGLWDGYTLAGGVGTTAGRLTPFAAGDSWRYQLAAGADRNGAAPYTVNPGATAGDVTVLPPNAGAVRFAQLRTGTGRIDVAAARDIVLNGANVSVFTGGTASVTGPVFDSTVVQGFAPTFTEHGGDVTLAAGRDITSGNNLATQLVNNWLWRAGRSSTTGDFSGPTNAPTAWWVNAASFLQGAGALGGGDLNVEAGRNVRSLNTSVPSNAFLDAATGELVSHNQGSLSVRAGGAVQGGVHYAQSGQIDLRAASFAAADFNNADPVVIAQGDNVARVQAEGDARTFGSFNPTLAPLPPAFTLQAESPVNTAFSTYGDDARLDVRSLVGDIEVGIGNVTSQSRTGLRNTDLGLASTQDRARLFTILPPTVDAVSFGGDTATAAQRWLAPAAQGQLRLLADGDVRGGVIAMTDLDPNPSPTDKDGAYVPTATSPISLTAMGLRTTGGRALADYNLDSPSRHAVLPEPLHAADTQPVAVVARTGNLDGLTLDVPKAAEITVAGDIGGGTRISTQNVNADNVTRIHAGGRIDLDATVDAGTAPPVQISGPGAAEILAGRDISLGDSGGIVSRGNFNNPNLPEGGASLLVAAGLGRGADGFVQQPDYTQVLQQFVRYDAFAATGRDAAVLNAQVLRDAKLSDAERAALQQALQNRAGGQTTDAAFDAWLAGLTPSARLRIAVELAQRVQAVANQRFVDTANTDSFLPGYLALRDLFPTLSSDAAGLRGFVSANPFVASPNADALRRQALDGLPDALRAALTLGLDNPAQASDPGSAFNQALAALDASTLANGSRQLVAQVQTVAGRELDALRTASRVDADIGTPFASGLDTLARGFAPAGAVGANGISLVFSQIKTEQSGDLAVFAPRGGVLVGLANPPVGAVEKEPFQLGLLTLGGGTIVGAVRDNFDVFRSRVFTTAGGDIHLWAGQGNVDAGRGPRDVAVTPPPRLVIDNNGIVTLDITASVSGSGIGALVTRDDQPPSNIRLIAPNGFIDAGEAGIRADSGTVTLGTNIVLNAGNISAGGGVSGGAVVVAPPAPVPQSSNSSSADKAVEQTQKALAAAQQEAEERAKKERRKRVTGEFIGFGDE